MRITLKHFQAFPPQELSRGTKSVLLICYFLLLIMCDIQQHDKTWTSPVVHLSVSLFYLLRLLLPADVYAANILPGLLQNVGCLCCISACVRLLIAHLRTSLKAPLVLGECLFWRRSTTCSQFLQRGHNKNLRTMNYFNPKKVPAWGVVWRTRQDNKTMCRRTLLVYCSGIKVVGTLDGNAA